MKIGKSVVSFSITASPNYKYKSINEVPYWSLYSRPGDCLQDKEGIQWRSDRPFTLAEIKQYLKRFPGRRLLNAYPRQSTKRRTSYITLVHNNEAFIYDKWTGEVYATFVMQDNVLRDVYIAPNAPGHISYYRKLAECKFSQQRQIYLKGE